jgi:predicted amino acid dehydrogenase
MLPSLSGYGFDVLRHLDATNSPFLTTGHALTVVSVVMAIDAALVETGRRLVDQDVAFVGLGSIGRATLELLLTEQPHPRSIMLCDVVGSARRLEELGQQLRETTGFSGDIRHVEADSATGDTPYAVYTADLIVGATSRSHVLRVDRLRSGTIVVDDSFPHCFDTQAAIARMRDEADVLLVGGGLLDCGPMERTIFVPEGLHSIQERIAQRLPFQALASCQLESVLQAADPQLPLIRGLVDPAGAQRYWTAARAAGLKAGPLHLHNYTLEERLLLRLRERGKE